MELIIQEIGQKISNSIKENLKTMVLERKDISEFIQETRKTLDEIGVKIVAEALETVDSLVKEDKNRKLEWRVKSSAKKGISTIFGQVNYKRTYYENKRTGEYKYLSDELVGIDVHDKIDTSLKAKLIDEAIEIPYRRSGQKASENLVLTGQTVMNSIRELDIVANNAVEVKEKNKSAKILFIEADEDHVALQDGKCIQPRLVYVHEGRIKIGEDRYKLKNIRYFSGIYSDSADLWVEVANYIEDAYDRDKIEKIYLSGDGASWIKQGKEWIKDSIYVLDRFHLSKYIKIATAHMPHTTPYMWQYINQQNKKNVKDLFKVLIEETDTKTKVAAIKEAKRYILNNWEGIKNQYNSDYVGCSAEGHISHILSSRLSSRPLGWSKNGVDQMSRLRAFKANGGNVYELMMIKKKELKKVKQNIKLEKRRVKRIISKSANEKLDNITILHTGKRTWAYEMLKSFRGA